MNPIDFCRMPGFHSTILLTYSFDPLFFERLALPSLRASGTGTILVVADKAQLASAENSWVGQLALLGKRYQLFGIRMSGSFHPKIIIRIGKEGGAVWVGSANITFAGWSVNRELGTAWQFGSEFADSGAWLPPLFSYLSTRGMSARDHTLLDRVLRERWISELPVQSDSAETGFLTTFEGQTLAAQLQERWSGRRFSTVQILTGSTDTRGAWLRELNSQYGVKEATVLVDSGRCSFTSTELKKLPVSVSVTSAVTEAASPLHAKFYWFDGPDGPAAVFGSANCSAAAWLVSPTNGGNHESIVVYDDPKREDFDALLEIFRGDTAPVDLETNENIESESSVKEVPNIEILSASRRDSSSPLVIRFNRDVLGGAKVIMNMADDTRTLRPSDNASVWVSEGPIDFSGVETAFVVVHIELDDSKQLQLQAWVNDFSELLQSAQGDDIDESFGNMGRARTTNEQREILKGLQKVSSAILEDADLLSDPEYLSTERQDEPTARGDTTPAAPLDPNDLVRSLGDSEGKQQQKEFAAGRGTHSLTLLGVMRALYEVRQDDLLEQESAVDDPNPPASKNGKKPKRKSADPVERDETEIDERFKEKLRRQTDQFLEKLSTREFADATSATQLVQAASYPLALSVISVRDKWASAESAQEWCRRAFDILFRQEYPGKRLGLIEFVAARYDESGQQEMFNQIVGDGTLWFAILSSVNQFSWSGDAGLIDRAFVLGDCYRNRHLVASADVGRLRTLISHDRQLRLVEVLAYAPRIDDVLSRLERRLEAVFDDLVAQQADRRIEFAPSDLMWSKNGGWGVLSETKPPGADYLAVYLHKRATERFVKHGFFVNVALAAKTDQQLRSFLDELESLAVQSQSSD